MSTITHLVGPPAAGKRTIGLALSARTGAALIDNHLINDPIFRAYGLDGVTPIPGWLWTLVEQVAEATKTAVRRAPASVSHILTNYINKAEAEDPQLLQEFRDLAADRGAQYIPVWLTCPAAELARRVDLPDRHAARVKLRDPETVVRLVNEKGLADPPPDALVLDTSTMSAQEAAERIAAWTRRTDSRS